MSRKRNNDYHAHQDAAWQDKGWCTWRLFLTTRAQGSAFALPALESQEALERELSQLLPALRTFVPYVIQKLKHVLALPENERSKTYRKLKDKKLSCWSSFRKGKYRVLFSADEHKRICLLHIQNRDAVYKHR